MEGTAKSKYFWTRKWPFRSKTLPELCFKFCKPGSSARVVCPALGHKAVEGRRAVWRHGEPLTVLNPPNYIIVLHSLEGLYPMHEDLPHTHTWGTHTNKKKTFPPCEQTKKKLVKEKANLSPSPSTQSLDFKREERRFNKNGDQNKGQKPPFRVAMLRNTTCYKFPEYLLWVAQPNNAISSKPYSQGISFYLPADSPRRDV